MPAAPIAVMLGFPAIGSGIGMSDYTFREKTTIVAGAVTAVVIVGWLAMIALAMLSAG